MGKVEARATNSYTGDGSNDRFMLELSVKNGQLQFKGSEHNSLLLKKIRDGDVVELGQATYMLNELIIENMNVVRKVGYIGDNPTKVPQFDMEKLPFFIFMGVEGFYLANIKTCIYQLLVKTKFKRSGFFLELEDGSLDYHFTHRFIDENNIEHEAHHRVCFRNDLLQFLEQHQ